MKNFYYFLTATNYFNFIQSKSFDLQKTIKKEKVYEITLFKSENSSGFPNLSVYCLNGFPNKIYSFDKNLQQLHDNYFANALKNTFTLQESLVIFITENLSEVKPFIEFLILQLIVRKRPNCLIICSTKNCINQNDVIDSLKHAWENNFLDFTIILESFEEQSIAMVDESVLIYHYNPFNDIVYEKVPFEDIEVFPDKLVDTYEYPFYVPNGSGGQNVLVRRPNGNIKILVDNYHSTEFAAKILNLNVETKNVNKEAPVEFDFLEKWKLDNYGETILSSDYLDMFIIPTGNEYLDVVALVPITSVPQTGFFFKMMFNFMVIFGTFSIFLCLFNYFKTLETSDSQDKTSGFGSLRVFDFVQLLFGQSITYKPHKAFNRVIILTTIVAAVKIINDFLLDIFLIQLGKKEIPFENYEDLYNSQLQTYSVNVDYLHDSEFIEAFVEDPYLLKILNRTLKGNDECLDTLIKWRNLSCIRIPLDPKEHLSWFGNSTDKTPTLKVAKPPILSQPPGFYWFAIGSPYAKKFSEIIQRIQETSLTHFPALVDHNQMIADIEKNEQVPLLSSKVEPDHLLVILIFCLSISTIAFVVEMIMFKIARMKVRDLQN